MNPTVHVMVDLETLGTTPGCVVLSFGAAAFCTAPTKEQPAATQHYKLSLPESLFRGLTVDPDTMSWWRKQSEQVWTAATANGQAHGLVLGEFRYWLDCWRSCSDGATGNNLRIWGDASSFDLVLLACVYRANSMAVPWDYREERDYRTVRMELNSEKPRSKVQHDGLSDAVAQLEHLKTLLKQLEGVGK